MIAPTTPSPPSEPIAQAIESPTPPLPRLSPTDHALLTRLLALNEDYPALAAQLAISQDAGAEAPRSPGSALPSSPVPCALSLVPLPDAGTQPGASGSVPSPYAVSRLPYAAPPDLLSLLTWSTLPHITAWLAFYHHLQDQHSRRLAITELQTLLKTSDNPIEKRRTATTLLRALDHKWPTEPRRLIVNPDRKGGARNSLRSSPGLCAPSPPSPRLDGGRVSEALRGPEGGVPVSVGASPTPPAAPPPIQNPQSKIQNPPPPSITPSPSHTPTTLAAAIAADLSTGNLLQTAATLAAISTDSLRAGADTVIERLEPHLGLPTSAHISPPAYHKPAPPSRHACRITISAHPRPASAGRGHPSHSEDRRGVSSLTLGFTKPHNAPWLLNSLDTT